MCKDLDIFRQNINTFLQLRTNHRFKEDRDWGKVLERFQKHGPTPSNADKICTRLMCKKYCTTEKVLPPDSVYATKINIDRMAIN